MTAASCAFREGTKFADFEDEVTTRLEQLLDISRSDAQAILEGQDRVFYDAWMNGSGAAATADAVTRAATV